MADENAVARKVAISAHKPLAELTPEKWNRVLAVNLTGPISQTCATAPPRAARWRRALATLALAAAVAV